MTVEVDLFNTGESADVLLIVLFEDENGTSLDRLELDGIKVGRDRLKEVVQKHKITASVLAGHQTGLPVSSKSLGSGPYQLVWRLSRARNSSRTSRSAKQPLRAEVVVSAPAFLTPRISTQRCRASMTTMTPWGCSLDHRNSATCSVSRSCSCGRLA